MICASANFIRHIGEDVQHIDGHFTSRPQHVSSGRDYDIDQLRSKLDVAVDNFNARGSGFNIDIVTLLSSLRCFVHCPDPAIFRHSLNNQKACRGECSESRFVLLSLVHSVMPLSSKTSSLRSFQLYQIISVIFSVCCCYRKYPQST